MEELGVEELGVEELGAAELGVEELGVEELGEAELGVEGVEELGVWAKWLRLGWLMIHQIGSKNLGHREGFSSSCDKCHTAVR
jgi:hypothetical protein